jgi:acetyl esterase/lipase
MIDWDTAYNNSAHIPGASALPERWKREAAAYRASGLRIEVDIPYGSAEREVFDLIWPDATPKGLAVFVHGGYWRLFSKSDWTHLAEGARASGWAVALPSYTLAPQARIAQITQQVGRAISKAATLVPGPIRLAGHSAGGHLVSRMACTDAPVAQDVRGRIAHVLSISGLHDLRPLLKTQMNDTLRLDLPEARRESAALLEPFDSAKITAWVGGGELPEFLRQTALLRQIWQGFDIDIKSEIDGTHDHFSVVDGLADSTSPITQAFVGAG